MDNYQIINGKISCKVDLYLIITINNTFHSNNQPIVQNCEYWVFTNECSLLRHNHKNTFGKGHQISKCHVRQKLRGVQTKSLNQTM